VNCVPHFDENGDLVVDPDDELELEVLQEKLLDIHSTISPGVHGEIRMDPDGTQYYREDPDNPWVEVRRTLTGMWVRKAHDGTWVEL
jgi:hypothetical protein